MDKETCTKYGEWEGWGTYTYNKDALGSGQSPSLTEFQGNTILIREWNDETEGNRGASTIFQVVPYNPIEEYSCNGAPAGATAVAVVLAIQVQGSANALPALPAPHARKSL